MKSSWLEKGEHLEFRAIHTFIAAKQGDHWKYKTKEVLDRTIWCRGGEGPVFPRRQTAANHAVSMAWSAGWPQACFAQDGTSPTIQSGNEHMQALRCEVGGVQRDDLGPTRQGRAESRSSGLTRRP